MIVTIIYLGSLLVLSQHLAGQWLPPFGLEGLWYYAAFAALLVGEYIVEPHFTSPAGALANGAAVVLAAASVSRSGAEVSGGTFSVGRAFLIVFGATLVLVAIVAAFTRDRDGWRGQVNTLCIWALGRFGRPRVAFGVLLFTAGFAAFSDSAADVALIYSSWFGIVAVDPVGAAFHSTRTLVRDGLGRVRGRVEAVEDPSVAFVRLVQGARPLLGEVVHLSDGKAGLIVDITQSFSSPIARVSFPVGTQLKVGTAVDRIDPAVEQVVGHVGRATTLDELVLDVSSAANATDIEEGRLLSVQLRDVACLYQIIGAEVVGESADGQTRDLVRVSARKLGSWDSKRTTFDALTWVPNPGAPVFLERATSHQFDPAYVGFVPGTAFGVRINVHEAVTHNTAILGILGIGKTYLAWELIKRMLVEGIKVVVVDISGKYSRHFESLHSLTVEEEISAEISSRISANYERYKLDHSHAGNVNEFEEELRGCLDKFVCGPKKLLIVNPNRFKVSRIEGFPRVGAADRLFDLTMVEVTRVIAESLLELCQEWDSRDELGEGEARVCVVLEEAHSLVPEWNSVADDGEKAAVNGTARAILQGRKYGMGCLLVTQRTANVTKSILNQCNTVFGLRNYDATGAGFLENYVGGSYSGLIASLKERHAIVFGKASSCNAPIIVRLNEADDVETGFWRDVREAVPVTVAADMFEDAAQEADGPGEPPPDWPDEGGF